MRGAYLLCVESAGRPAPLDRSRAGGRRILRAVVQRVTRARVTVDARVAGEIQTGPLVLLGVGRAGQSGSPHPISRKKLRTCASSPTRRAR